jgi:uncharacterized membrane protein YphA (DoxX/SURF4 family)
MATVFPPLMTTAGRALLGLYFILPGLSKIPGWEGTAALMAEKGMALVTPFLLLTIVLQIGGGLGPRPRLPNKAHRLPAGRAHLGDLRGDS